MRCARLRPRHRYPSLDASAVYRVLGDAEPAGYVWIAAPGDAYLNPDRRCVYLAHFEVWDAEDDPPRCERTSSASG